MTASTHLPSAAAWQRYVAIGDSFTEGLHDSDPRSPAQPRGWADLLAASLARRRHSQGQSALEYANLAVRGRLLGPIITDQLPAALDLAPDLLSMIGGGNDILRPGADVDALLADLDSAVATARRRGTTVLLGTGVDPGIAPVIRRTRPKVAVFNAGVWSIAHRHGAHVLDLWGMRSLADPRMWAPDRIHLTTEGHRRVAQAALVGLDLDPDEPAWDDPLTPLPPVPRVEQWRADARWAREHAYPWVRRRMRRQSSGDLVVSKRPVPAAVDPED